MTATTNRSLFARDPLTFSIPNDGVSKLAPPRSSGDWDVLQYELSSFVSEGAYSEGLTRVLESFLRNMDKPVQPAVWVSGFYGSGKSHLVRVLQHLWADTALPDGSTARNLVGFEGATAIEDALTELSALGRRLGAAPWSAGGMLATASSGDLNLGLLGIVLSAAGLPEKVAPTRLRLWLRAEGIEDAVVATLQGEGKDVAREFAAYNLSVPLARAVLAHRPDLAAEPRELLSQFKAQFPDVSALDVPETVTLLREVLTGVGGGTVPPTLIVLDEVQQFIDDDGARAIDVQRVVEAIQSGFDGRVLVVATGQQDVTATSVLQKIQDRFSVKVTLASQDVDAVVRSVLLRKDPAHLGDLTTSLDRASGEISKELAGSAIAHRSDDDAVLVADYPLLPARRRLWEEVLRQADANGRAGQLRSQLRVVHEANRAVAERPVGTVIGADFLYENKNHDFQATGRLLKEVQSVIADQAKNSDDGRLRARLLGTVFLIAQLPTDGLGATGLRASADHLADLLVEDLATDGPRLRQRVPEVLASLVSEGVLQQEGSIYRLQTREGREWGLDFGQRRAGIISDPGRFQAERDQALRTAVEREVPPRVLQGTSKASRTIALQWGDVEPQVTTSLPVWVRSEFAGFTPRQFSDLVRGAGNESPIVFVHLRQGDAGEELRSAVLDLAAAKEVLETRAHPSTDEGRQAQAAMISRRDLAMDRVRRLVAEVVAAAPVELGGGANIEGTKLGNRLAAGAERAAARLFPDFAVADDKRWATVLDRLKQGNTEPLGALGHTEPTEAQPVVREISKRIATSWISAKSLHDDLSLPPYGWGAEAVRGAIATLVAAGLITARDGAETVDARAIASGTRYGNLGLRRESAVVTTGARLAVRRLLGDVGVTAPASSDLSPLLAKALVELRSRAESISGPAPLPQITPPALVQEIAGMSGNEQVLGFLAAAEPLRAYVTRLDSLAERRTARLVALDNARALAVHAQSLPETESAHGALESLESTRSLLEDPDPISPIVGNLARALRNALNAAQAEYESQRSAAVASLEDDETFAALNAADREARLLAGGLEPRPTAPVATDADLLSVLSHRPPATWPADIDALPARAQRLRGELLTERTPQAVPLGVPAATLRTEGEVDAYLKSLRARLIAGVAEHGIVAVRPS